MSVRALELLSGVKDGTGRKAGMPLPLELPEKLLILKVSRLRIPRKKGIGTNTTS
jgi:hypothetical protein